MCVAIAARLKEGWCQKLAAAVPTLMTVHRIETNWQPNWKYEKIAFNFAAMDLALGSIWIFQMNVGTTPGN